jgi:hypothetical protein
MKRTGGTKPTRRLFASFALASFCLSFAPLPAEAQAAHQCPPAAGAGPVLSLAPDHDCHASRAGTCSGTLHCLGISAAALGAAPAWNTDLSEVTAAPVAPLALHASSVAPPTPPPNN